MANGDTRVTVNFDGAIPGVGLGEAVEEAGERLGFLEDRDLGDQGLAADVVERHAHAEFSDDSVPVGAVDWEDAGPSSIGLTNIQVLYFPDVAGALLEGEMSRDMTAGAEVSPETAAVGLSEESLPSARFVCRSNSSFETELPLHGIERRIAMAAHKCDHDLLV